MMQGECVWVNNNDGKRIRARCKDKMIRIAHTYQLLELIQKANFIRQDANLIVKQEQLLQLMQQANLGGKRG